MVGNSVQMAFLYEKFMKYKKTEKKLNWKILKTFLEQFLVCVKLELANGNILANIPSFYYLADELLITDNFVKNKEYLKLLGKLRFIYNDAKNENNLPILKSPIIIKSIDEFIEEEKIKTIESVQKSLEKNIDKSKYYLNNNEFSNALKRVLSNKKSKTVVICYFYEICKKLISNIPELLNKNQINKIGFDELYNLCWTYLKTYKTIYEIKENPFLGKEEIFYYLNMSKVNSHLGVNIK